MISQSQWLIKTVLLLNHMTCGLSGSVTLQLIQNLRQRSTDALLAEGTRELLRESMKSFMKILLQPTIVSPVLQLHSSNNNHMAKPGSEGGRDIPTEEPHELCSKGQECNILL